MSHTASNKQGPAKIVDALVDTLRKEEQALQELTEAAAAQLEALREHNTDGMEAKQEATHATVGTLEQLRSSRERHMRLLGRLLGFEETPSGVAPVVEALRERPGMEEAARTLLNVRTSVREQAQQAKKQCEDLDFALRYALSLGQEMMQAISALNVPAPPKVYTARGDASKGTSTRSIVDRVG